MAKCFSNFMRQRQIPNIHQEECPGGRARVNAGSFCVFILYYSNIQFNFRNILLKMRHWWAITRNAFTLEENRKGTSLGSAQGCRWRWWIISITLNKYLYRIIRNTLPRPDWEGLTWDGKLTLSSGWEGDLGRARSRNNRMRYTWGNGYILGWLKESLLKCLCVELSNFLFVCLILVVIGGKGR